MINLTSNPQPGSLEGLPYHSHSQDDRYMHSLPAQLQPYSPIKKKKEMGDNNGDELTMMMMVNASRGNNNNKHWLSHKLVHVNSSIIEIHSK